MSSSAEDFLSIAEELNDFNDEVKIRTSISRSYYSAYHLCRRHRGIPENSEWVGGTGGVHQRLMDDFKYSSTLSDRGIAYILAELKGKRVLADYKLSVSLDVDDAKSSLKMVHSLLAKIKKHN